MTLFPLSEGQRPEVGKPLPINKLSQRPAFLCLFRGWPKKTRYNNKNNKFIQYGSKDGAVARALASHQCGRGSNLGVDVIYVGRDCCWFSPLLRDVFLRDSAFPLSLKTNTSKFQFDLECTDTFQKVLINSLVLRG